MFKFGQNWASFSRQLDEERIKQATTSLASLFGENVLERKSFLDIGCGSGLFSIAAARLGAHPIIGIDVDPVSVDTSRINYSHWAGDQQTASFLQVSVLDDGQLKALGAFDAVYSWGVLHHTGDMAQAIRNAARCVRPGGYLMIAIYNRHWSSPIWKQVKWLYNKAGPLGQRVLVWIFMPIIFVAKWLVTFKNPFKMKRGMNFMHNVIDWVGGYPYEYASVAEMTARLKALGFDLLSVRPAGVPTGCNEFVCRRKA
jgi:SAM-dependent methyltransferase